MSQAKPPQELRPWYYKSPALFPVFLLGWPIWMEFQMVILWPAWAILIIRSPWHQGFVAGTLAWAMLMSGGALIGLALISSNLNPLNILLLVLPGLIYTLVTQVLWAKSKQEILASASLQLAPPAPGPADNLPPRSQRERLRRRLRRRAARPGRSSRHPF